MKLQAHLPTVSISERDLHVAMIALVSLFGAAVLVLALQSGGLLDNPLLEQQEMSPITGSQISAAHRVSLDLHLWSPPISPWKRFSVAHPLPATVASAQRFSIGSDARGAFKVAGDAALGDMLGQKETLPQLKPRSDRLLLMLMLFGLDKRRG